MAVEAPNPQPRKETNMSSYFDAVRREVAELSRECPNTVEGLEAFLFGMVRIETKMKRHCELFAGDVETPEDVRQAIMVCIALNEVRYDGGEFLGGRYGSEPDSKPFECKATQYAASCRSSKLEAEMHSLWHDIARMRYVMRYGPISDDPEWAVQRRDTYAETRKGPRKFTDKAPLVCNDYRLPKKVLATDREHCPKCGKAHSSFNNAPSYDGYRIAPCGQKFVLEDPK